MNTAKILPIERDSKENQNNGHISLFRSIQDHWIWQDAERLKWWLDLLLSANYKDAKVPVKGVLIDCKRGQSVVAVKTWAKRWRVDRGKVRRFFDTLESEQMIVQKPTPLTTIITICNYDSYQSHRPSKRPSNDQQTHTNNKENNTITITTRKKEKRIFSKPEEYELVNHFTKRGLDDFTAMAEAKKFLEYYEDNEWRCGKEKKLMENWKTAATGWKNRMKATKNNYGDKSNSGGKKPGVSEARIEALDNLGRSAI